MRENENRPLNPSAYTTPASVFNTLAVDIDSENVKTDDFNELPLRTIKIPANELLKLDPIVSSDSIKSQAAAASAAAAGSTASQPTAEENNKNFTNPGVADRYPVNLESMPNLENPPAYPIPCEIINALTQQTHSVDPMYKVIKKTNDEPICGGHDVPILYQTQSSSYPYGMSPQQNLILTQQQIQNIPQNQQLNNNFLFSPNSHQQFISSNLMFTQNPQNLPPQPDSQKSRSLERNQTNLNFGSRMSSLERVQNSVKQVRSNSLTRQLSAGQENYVIQARSSSFERGNTQQYPGGGCRTNSLERNQQQPNPSGRGGSLERNQSISSTYDLMKSRGYRGGSLERNHQGMPTNVRAGSLERNPPQYVFRSQMKPAEPEPFQEEIYDFGGANVKSCASIALSKSISKGMLPPDTILPHQLPPPVSSSGQNSPLPTGYYHHSYPLSPQQQQHQHLQQQLQQQQHLQQQHQQQLPNYSQNMTYTQMYPRVWPVAGQKSWPPTQQQQQSMQQQQSPNILRNLPPMAQSSQQYTAQQQQMIQAMQKIQLPQNSQQQIAVQQILSPPNIVPMPQV